MGWSMKFSRDWEMLFSGEEDWSTENILCSFSGSFLDGNAFAGIISPPVRVASSFWKPASSRAPSPRVERMEARCPME